MSSLNPIKILSGMYFLLVLEILECWGSCRLQAAYATLYSIKRIAIETSEQGLRGSYLKVCNQTQWRIQGEIPGCHGSPLSDYSYVALVQLLASYLSVFVV